MDAQDWKKSSRGRGKLLLAYEAFVDNLTAAIRQEKASGNDATEFEIRLASLEKDRHLYDRLNYIPRLVDRKDVAELIGKSQGHTKRLLKRFPVYDRDYATQSNLYDLNVIGPKLEKKLGHPIDPAAA